MFETIRDTEDREYARMREEADRALDSRQEAGVEWAPGLCERCLDAATTTANTRHFGIVHICGRCAAILRADVQCEGIPQG